MRRVQRWYPLEPHQQRGTKAIPTQRLSRPPHPCPSRNGHLRPRWRPHRPHSTARDLRQHLQLPAPDGV